MLSINILNRGCRGVWHDVDLDPLRDGSGVAHLSVGHRHPLHTFHLLHHTTQEEEIGSIHQ